MVRTNSDDDTHDAETKAAAFDALAALEGADDVPDWVFDEACELEDPTKVIDLAVAYVDDFEDPTDDAEEDEPRIVDDDSVSYSQVKCTGCKKTFINRPTADGHTCPVDEVEHILTFDTGDRVEVEYESKTSGTVQTKRGTITSVGESGSGGACMKIDLADDDRYLTVNADGDASTSRDGKHLATVSTRADVEGIRRID